jgi:hypothetical protein
VSERRVQSHFRAARTASSSRRLPAVVLRALLAALAGAGAALLVSCAGSSKSLIPTAQAGPLREDFELVERAARSGHGSCASTEAAVAKTEADFAALPGSVDAGLRARLREGIAKLHEEALELCAQPSVQSTPTTSTNAPSATTAPPTTKATTQSPPTTTTKTSTAPGGGTPAEEEERSEGAKEKGKGKNNDAEAGPAGGAAPGGPAPGGPPAPGEVK